MPQKVGWLNHHAQPPLMDFLHRVGRVKSSWEGEILLPSDLLITQMEVTNNPWKGHLQHPERSQLEEPNTRYFDLPLNVLLKLSARKNSHFYQTFQGTNCSAGGRTSATGPGIFFMKSLGSIGPPLGAKFSLTLLEGRWMIYWPSFNFWVHWIKPQKWWLEGIDGWPEDRYFLETSAPSPRWHAVETPQKHFRNGWTDDFFGYYSMRLVASFATWTCRTGPR